MNDGNVKVTLKPGTVAHVDGVPVCLLGETDVETAEGNRVSLNKHADKPFAEYPKALEDGRVVQSADEESDPSPKASPLDDVSIEMDNPAFDAPKKKSASKKK